MHPRARAVLVVALLAVTAGCGGVADGPTAESPATTVSTTPPTASATATPATTAPTTTGAPSTTTSPTPTSANRNLPPGVTEDGVADPQALAETHADLLRSQPYVANVSIVDRFPNGTLAQGRNRTVRYADGEYVHDHRPRGPMAISGFDRQVIWGNGTVALARSVGPDGTAVFDRTSQPIEFGVPDYWQETVYGVVGAGGFDVEFVEDADHVTFRLTSDNPRAAGRDNATITLLVDDRGFVREYRYAYDQRLRGDVPVHTVRTVEFSMIDGSEVGRPSWYETAVNATGDADSGPGA